MKSLIIRQKGRKVIHVKETKKGIDVVILNELVPEIKVTAVMDDNTRITL